MFLLPRRGHLLAATFVVLWSCAAAARAQCEPIETKIFPADAMREAGFGRGVAVDGDLAVVGARNDGNTSPPGGVFNDGPTQPADRIGPDSVRTIQSTGENHADGTFRARA